MFEHAARASLGRRSDNRRRSEQSAKFHRFCVSVRGFRNFGPFSGSVSIFLFPDGIKFSADFLGWCLGCQRYDHDGQCGYKECRKQFINIPGASHRAYQVFPYEYHHAACYHSGQGTLQVVAQNGVDPTIASLLLSLESVFSVLAGWVILGQKLSGRELFGCALVFAAVLLVQIPIA